MGATRRLGPEVRFGRRSRQEGEPMRRSTVPAAVAALALGVPLALTPGAPARAAGAFVETNPSTVQAGDDIGLRAGCNDNLTAATVTSDAFGTVTVAPHYGFLTATVRVPARTKAADFRVLLDCPGVESATTTLHVIARVRPSRGPATGGGGTAGGGTAPVLIGGGIAVMAGGLLLGALTLRRRRLG
jgi:hypothetical protein